MKAKVLCDNSVFGFNNVLAEHGWSIHLETQAGNFLMDTGTGQTIVGNAEILGMDFTKLDGIIFSHHHVDHTGGLAKVLKKTGPIPVYSHFQLFKSSYSLYDNGKKTYLGIPYSQACLEGLGATFSFNKAPMEIAPKIWLTGEVPRVTSYEKGDTDQVVLNGNSLVQDSLLDDQSVIIESDSGLVILLGCAHAGLINILKHAIQMTNTNKIHAIIGGTHLGMVTADQCEATIDELMSFDIDFIAASHCTGIEACIDIAKKFGHRFLACKVGSLFEF